MPEEQYFVNGEAKALARRAFAARLPPEVVHIKGKGYQAVDRHEGLTAARGATIDLPRLAGLVENWPQGGWEKDEVMAPYRLALLRAVSTGHFLRKASGSNA